MKHHLPSLLAASLLALALPASAASGLNLANYTLSATYNLPKGLADEASAITWNWDSDTLFVIGDEGDAIVQMNKQGQLLSFMSLSGFDDTEGLTYVGGGKFVVLEERIQDAFLLSYVAGGSASRNSLPALSMGPTVGNVGLEGLSYDPRDGSFVVVKEKTPMAVNLATLNFAGNTVGTSSLFPPASLGVLDLADVQVLATSPAFAGQSFADNLLLFSQESARLLEVTRSGSIVSQFDFSALAPDAEGVTIDANGFIYIVSENGAGSNSLMFVLTPVPEAQTWAMLLAGLGLLAARRRR